MVRIVFVQETGRVKLLDQIKVWQFTLFFTLLNLIQAWGTELTSDEAYYWFYSLHMDWGFYDHPPMVALLTFFGRNVLSNELGVRMFHVLVFSAGIHIVLSSLSTSVSKWAMLLILSLPLLNYVSFLVFPDTALVAFSAFALIAYRKFLNANSLKNTLFLGLCLTAMLYSKYHTVIFVLLIVLSNLRLLKTSRFYVAILIASLLFIPHLLWQYNHEFPSFKYHLSGRSEGFQMSNLSSFVIAQFVVLGLGSLLLLSKFKAQDRFERALKFITIGTILFFTLSSFRGFVHIHWTSLTVIPLFIIGAIQLARSDKPKMYVAFLIPFVLVSLFIRLALLVDLFPAKGINGDYYHGRQLWAEDIDSLANGRSVLFEFGNAGLREAPMYQFYSGNKSVALYPRQFKKSQYQLIGYEDDLQHQDVLYLEMTDLHSGKPFETRMGPTIYYRHVDNYRSGDNIKMDFSATVKDDCLTNIQVEIFNHRAIPVEFPNGREFYFRILKRKDEEIELWSQEFDSSFEIKAGMLYHLSFELDWNAYPNNCLIELGFRGGEFKRSVNLSRTFGHPSNSK